MRTYRIIATCDPYNANHHYHGQTVVRYNGATPVEWVMEDYLTLDKAQSILDAYASDLGDDYLWNDDTLIEELKKDGVDVSWYKGEGVYTPDGVLVYQHGDIYLRDDVVTYRIEEILR